MPSNRSHNKSRHGCKRCKERRVKCDQQSPCQHCSRRNEPCSLILGADSGSVLHALAARTTTSAEALKETHSRSAPGSPVACDNVLLSSGWAQDLQLMAHFMTQTCKTLSPRQDMRSMWQNQAPQDFARYPFLAHGMLSIAALHLASLDAPNKVTYTRLYHLHMSKALPAYRAVLATRDDQSSGPCFAMAHLIAADSLAAISDNAPPEADGSTPPVSLATILRLIVVVRGFQDITIQIEDEGASNDQATRPYGLSKMPIYRKVGSSSSSLSSPLLSQMSSGLVVGFSEGGNDHDDESLASSGCLEALFHLQTLERDLAQRQQELKSSPAANSDGPSPSCSGINPAMFAKWLVSVPDQFVTSLQNEKPLALQILASFAELTECVGHLWYFQSWSSNALKAIRGSG